ncbi:unnamed protein product [Caenorhabditis auriculariae]|uniref:L-Fucosyltransferase n=1 Tax=Caenorhabditis auriculariae TaxID=2777116 RepID=A0A8S1GMG4_9PELO|nr:unnamed protein product [Caenorhabditis auriculariae]
MAWETTDDPLTGDLMANTGQRFLVFPQGGDEVSLENTKWPIPKVDVVLFPNFFEEISSQRYLFSNFNFSRGMGNQLFQVASLLELAKQNDATLVLPTTLLLRRAFSFHDVVYLDDQNYRQAIDRISHSEELKAKVKLFTKSNLQILNGYFQNLRYFHPHSQRETRRRLSWLEPVKNLAVEFLENVNLRQVVDSAKRLDEGMDTDQALEADPNAESTVIVGIHVRRGFDVVYNERNVRHGHATAPLDYYQHAIDKATADHSKVAFVICSDNMAWARKNLKFVKGVGSFWCPGPREVDMAILGMCDELVLSTGTFSWWSAYLNVNSQLKARYYAGWPKKGSILDKMINKTEFFLPDWTAMT